MGFAVNIGVLLLQVYMLALICVPTIVAYLVAPKLGFDSERFAMLVLLASILGLAYNAVLGSLMFPPNPRLLG